MNLEIQGELHRFKGPLVMGILNLSPDSFYDGGKNYSQLDVLRNVESMLEEGADIIDIGAYSSRPGTKVISSLEEQERLDKFIPELIKNFSNTLFSVDTFRSEIARKSVEMGISIVNDISGGIFDKDMMAIVASLKVPYIIMHMQGNPQNMQEKPSYKDVASEVFQFLSDQVKKAKKEGINDVIIDPGFGFGKTIEHNYDLLNKLKSFKALECPLLIGISRKSMINKVLKTSPNEALNGSTVLNTIALLNGADILRVHDVKQAKEAVKIVSFMQKA